MSNTALNSSIGIVVESIQRAGLDEYDLPTPCSEYSVRELIDHVAFMLTVAHTSATREPPNPGKIDRSTFLSGRPDFEWPALSGKYGRIASEAWRSPKSWQGSTHFVGRHMPAVMVGQILIFELAIHA